MNEVGKNPTLIKRKKVLEFWKKMHLENFMYVGVDLIMNCRFSLLAIAYHLGSLNREIE